MQLSPADESWRRSVFGSDLGDERYFSSGFPSGGFENRAATVNRPREVGATLEFFFD